jgi:hypothetical protein
MVELTLEEIKEGLKLPNMIRAVEVRQALLECGLGKDKWNHYEDEDGTRRMVRVLVIK